MPSFFEKIGQNIQKNLKPEHKTSQNLYNGIGWAALGAVTNKIIPTALQGWFGWDMSGPKGAVTGMLSSSFIGLAADRPAMAAGSAAEFSVHLLYVYGNDQIASLFGTPIPAMDSNSVVLSDNDVPDGYEVIDVGGQKILAHSKESELNDYTNQLPEQQLADYTNQLPEQKLNDYTNQLPEQKLNDFVNKPPEAALADSFDFADFDSVIQDGWN